MKSTFQKPDATYPHGLFARIFKFFDTKPKIPSDRFKELRKTMSIDEILKISKKI